MNKHLKTLLIVTTIILPLSACSGHLRGKTDSGYAKDAKHCKLSKSMEKAQKNADKVLKALDDAAANTSDAATKKHLQKIIKDADKLANEIGKCKRMCDAKANGENAAPDAKAKKKKAAPATKPAAAGAAKPAM